MIATSTLDSNGQTVDGTDQIIDVSAQVAHSGRADSPATAAESSQQRPPPIPAQKAVRAEEMRVERI